MMSASIHAFVSLSRLVFGLAGLLPAAAFALAVSLQAASGTDDALAQGFRNPPPSAKPQVWWHWMNRNVTKEGITADLEALERNGLGGAQIFNLDYGIPTGAVEFMTPAWFEMMAHASKEADRLGLELGIHNCSGWSSSGGPWITPDMAMQLVTTSEVRVKGPSRFARKLEKPKPPEGKFDEYYRDIAVLACPTPQAELSGPGFRLPDWRTKAGAEKKKKDWVWKFGEEPEAPADAVYPKQRVLDLTKSMKPDGDLAWDVPAGDWTILRIGYGPRNRTNTHPEVPAGRGLELDKLSRAALDLHFRSFVDPLAQALGPLKGKSFTNLLIDSYEVGPQNWTGRFGEEFRKRRGYDLTPYLLAYTGRVVDSSEVTERFLWDVRRTIADLFHDNYWGYFSDLCHQRGFKSFIEPYEGPFSYLDNALTADVPMTEFWGGTWLGEIHEFGGRPSYRHRMVASGAHLALKPVVAAESFTNTWANDRFTQYPYAMKALGDFHFCEGVNRFYFHDFTHQPWVDERLVPGLTMGPWGLHFARTTTWWEMSKAWMEYIARCQHLLQSGVARADILAFTGEDAGLLPRWEKSGDVPPVPPGYDFEFVNAPQLLASKVEGGEIVVPAGLHYRLLVLPEARHTTLSVVRKLAELVEAGAAVVGPAPSRSPSLADFGSGDDEIRRLAARLWGEGLTADGKQTGRGRVFPSSGISQALAALGLKPDFEAGPPPEGQICFKHRSTPAAEIYFVSNQSGRPVMLDARFRIVGKMPELWDALTGTIELAPLFKESAGTTTVPLTLAPSGSVFVVFRKPAPDDHLLAGKAPVPEALRVRDGNLFAQSSAAGEYEFATKQGRAIKITVPAPPAPIDLSRDWDVAFPPHRGAPASVHLPALTSLTKQADPGVRYFSGTATYTRQFNLPDGLLAPNRETRLDLGEVDCIARIRLNGTDLGVVWTAPFEVDLTKNLHTGANLIEIQVANLWANRLIGDAGQADDCRWIADKKPLNGWMLADWPAWYPQIQSRDSPRVAFATWKFYEGGEEPPPSGLVGPVTLRFVSTVPLALTP